MKAVPRIGRILDLVGLLLFLVGGGLYARAWLGFRSVPDFEPGVGGSAFAATELADGFRPIQHVGTALMVAGVAVFIAAWWVARRPPAA
jgi:hypothetical protein